ncbi:DUF1846 domain-containing protein [Feifania hominis]|uniref:DUF1846 domain-containing protein n=1 Tax=Feifania hominis TaxID=2763660 RepID=A0A926DCL3_9FIRM|nr:DUF1846 domain-containing protein [Feifania hominis]MBC8536500.1 DUF1846 domain-containing protein [Feifania hominis]
MQIGFDNKKYVQMQTEHIRSRIRQFDNKLYLEFGGKLFDDYHAARVLPGFDVNGKIRLLQEFRDQAEIIFCINAADIENNKIRADFGITYDMDVLRIIDNLRSMGLYINSIVITQYRGQSSADTFRKKLERRGVKTYLHYPIKGYPTDVDLVVSDQGYGANDYVETTRPLVVVTAPGPCSGKLATCLSQLYHEFKRGVRAGYAKFETFPIWNLPLKHPVNLAYEAATADLNDVNMIDPFHLEAYGETAVNYNRDIATFPVLQTILEKITGDSSVYQSPTDMGVNMAGYAIFDDEVVRAAACQEIIRRYYKARCDYKQGRTDQTTAQRVELILKQLDLKPEDRVVVEPALVKSKLLGVPVMAMQLPDGRLVTGKASNLMSAASSCTLNAIKELAGIADDLHLLSPVVLEPIINLKKNVLGSRRGILSLDEVLIALSICAATNPMVELATGKLAELKSCEAHCSFLIGRTDETALRKLGVNLTCEPEFPTKDLYFI